MGRRIRLERKGASGRVGRHHLDNQVCRPPWRHARFAKTPDVLGTSDVPPLVAPKVALQTFLLLWFPHVCLPFLVSFGLVWGSSVPLRLFLVLLRYAPLFPGIAVVGDNTASLQVALSGKAKGSLGALARELFLRKAREDWHYQVGHLPSEHNSIADFLSRLAQPGAPAAPLAELEGAAEVPVPDLASLWAM